MTSGGPGFWKSYRAEQALRTAATSYVARLTADPPEADVAWLGAIMLGKDHDHARWELRYARRALGLLVAERDALNDRTASVVAESLEVALERDPNVAKDRVEIAERQFNARLGAYRDAFTKRSAKEGLTARLARELLSFSTAIAPDPDKAVADAGAVLGRYMVEAAEGLRQAFGEATLPEDVPPSQAMG